MSKPEKVLSTKSIYIISVTLVILLLIPVTITAIINSRPSLPEAAVCYDFTGDGRVDDDDMNLFMTYYGAESDDEDGLNLPILAVYAHGRNAVYDPRFDFDNDGDIDRRDRETLESHLGETCPPTLNFSATKTRIDKGGSSTLKWSTTRTSSVTISNIGNVAKSGSKIIKPSKTATYKITAQGPGGTLTKSIKITVVIPSTGTPTDSSVTSTTTPVVTPVVTTTTSSSVSSISKITVKINPLSELSGELKVKLSIEGVKFSREVTMLKTTKEVLVQVPKDTLKLNKSYVLKIAGDKLLTKKTRFKSSKPKVTVKVGSLYLGDLDGNNNIGDTDISLIASGFSEGGLGDLNFDGRVNSLDYSILLKNLGKKGS